MIKFDQKNSIIVRLCPRGVLFFFFIALQKLTVIKCTDLKLNVMASLLKVFVHALLSSCHVIIEKVMAKSLK